MDGEGAAQQPAETVVACEDPYGCGSSTVAAVVDCGMSGDNPLDGWTYSAEGGWRCPAHCCDGDPPPQCDWSAGIHVTPHRGCVLR